MSQLTPRNFGEAPAYTHRLSARLTIDAPTVLNILGEPAHLALPMTAFLCSRNAPGAAILRCFDAAAAWREAGRCVVGGFHSPMERECLEILLRGKQPVVMTLARAMGRPRLAGQLRKALNDGRLTIVSPFEAHETRMTNVTAQRRNRVAAALAAAVTFGYIAPGSALNALAAEATGWGVPCSTLYVPKA